MKKLLISIILLLGGAAVFVFGSPYYSVFPTNRNQTYLLALTGILVTIAVILKRIASLSVYWQAAYALGIASAATLVLGTGFLNLHSRTVSPLGDIAVDKFSQFLHVVPIILVLTWIKRDKLGSIFIKVGNLKRGLIFGLVSFAGFTVLALAVGGLSIEIITSRPEAVPWLLVFVFSNAIMEELWFRGIFLRHYQALIGKNAAILVTAIIFGTSHINATYSFPGGGVVFGLLVIGLGFVGAYAMLKDDSLIGPVLFHAGYDLAIILPVLNSL
jgi:membrane protease YdiL (CAAX protease family)